MLAFQRWQFDYIRNAENKVIALNQSNRLSGNMKRTDLFWM